LTPLIPGLDNTITVAIFGLGTILFVISMRIFYKSMKAKKDKEPRTEEPESE